VHGHPAHALRTRAAAVAISDEVAGDPLANVEQRDAASARQDPESADGAVTETYTTHDLERMRQVIVDLKAPFSTLCDLSLAHPQDEAIGQALIAVTRAMTEMGIILTRGPEP
jgi:hypothetical protein